MSRVHTRTTLSPEQTAQFGEKLGAACRGSEVILLSGPLGAGKTHLTKGIARGLGIDPHEVTSPTFTLQAIHHGRLPLYHVDLYRVENPLELAHLELFEEIEGPGVTVIEWPEKGKQHIPPDALRIRIIPAQGDERRLEMTLEGDDPPVHLAGC